MSQVMSYRGSPLTPPRGLWVLAVSFPSPAQALNLCMICEKNFHYDFPWLCGFFHISVHLSGPRLAAPRWGKASHRLEWVWPWTWGKNSPENCLVDLGPDTRTSTQSRRLVRRKGASWSLHWPSGANSLAHMQLKCIFMCLCDCCVLAFLCFWESIN